MAIPSIPQHKRKKSGNFWTLNAQLLLGIFTCGLWFLLVPSLYLWRRGSRIWATLWVALVVITGFSLGNSQPPEPPASLVSAAKRPSASPTIGATKQARPAAPPPTKAATSTMTAAPTKKIPKKLGSTATFRQTIAPKAIAAAKPTPKPAAKPAPKTTPAPKPAPVSATEFQNCTAMHEKYPHGVGRPGARDQTTGTPVTNFVVSSALYSANAKSDRDDDGIACEQA